MVAPTPRGIEESARELIKPAGFTWRGGMFRKTLQPGIEGRLGLPISGWEDGGRLIHPTVLIWHERVETKRTPFYGSDPREQTTAMRDLLVLAGDPGPMPWVIVHDETAVRAALLMIRDAIDAYAIPWLEANCELTTLAETLTENPGKIERQVIVQLALGHADIALRMLDSAPPWTNPEYPYSRLMASLHEEAETMRSTADGRQ